MPKMKNEERLLVEAEKLAESPYSEILCYPRPEKHEIAKRIHELKNLGVKTLEFFGNKNISGIPVLGKGCVGIVVAAYLEDGEKVALKIRRVDADRADMRHEAEMLKKANSAGVGPKLLGFTDNFLLMQYIDGKLLPEWLDKTKSQSLTKKILRNLLQQCFKLDQIGLDHGELSNAAKHLIISFKNEPYILDFETASDKRKPANLTSLAQYIFVRKPIGEKIAKIIGEIDRQKLIATLRSYKREKTKENFEKLLEICGLKS